MSDHTPREKLENAYAAWHASKGKSQDTWLELMADDVCLHSSGGEGTGLDFARDCRSRSDVVGYFTSLLREWEMIHWTPDSFVDKGDVVAMFGRCKWRSRASGEPVEVDIAHLWRFADGKAVELLEVFDSAKVVAVASRAGRAELT